jgi:cobyrinic acid a,c-diamide synthase
MSSLPEPHTAACPRLLIAALRGGSGKTLVTVGLTRALRAQGLRVATFKKGPDYIDAAWLSRVAERPCRNLDGYLMPADQILRSVGEHGASADLSLIEGNHGLYDGLGSEGVGSSAELARLLRAPVILLVDATRASRTVAAMVLGCQRMDPRVSFAGVILNRVGTPRQEAVIQSALREICGLPVLGSIPRIQSLALPQRHLGLLTPEEHSNPQAAISLAEEAIQSCVDLQKIRKAAQSAPALAWERAQASLSPSARVRIGVVRDSAFTFYYPENLESLERLGAALVEVNALRDRDLPRLDALYIGGGYPETHAEALSANAGFRRAVRREIEGGLPVMAECGGLIYLAEAMVMGGVTHPMVGVFPVTFQLGARPQGHGYVSLRADGCNPFFSRGAMLRGHEFRYSFAKDALREKLCFGFRMERGYGFDGEHDGLVYKNALASFAHLHALGAPEWAEALVRKARCSSERREAA